MLRAGFLASRRGWLLRMDLARFASGKKAPNKSSSVLGAKGKRKSAEEEARGKRSKSAADWQKSSPLFALEEQKTVIDKMIRVDHAGELGARQIYAGQLAVFRGTPIESTIQEMADQEKKHMDAFDGLIAARRVRPTAMMPIWRVAGYALGFGTAMLGKEAAMACTVAVEEVIAEHYNDQVRQLMEDDFQDEGELRDMFKEFRDDELEHKDTGIEHDAASAPMYRPLTRVIKAGCYAAIFVSERV
eukprot:Plantae.Rhodophyta-Purpureofilum_apyrenoidigerum.ctg5742.p1 GENE.Plantae.Rhodophyta-Purpureofilum_apyrenoidigerum.ctg5742~~Plantae.Rhodophyta-Purpureofilum_apyrenoidigerum.ctg5742.p1  ORF type:complete len:245 (-),score=55.80 Plantae.Rhodophyta-Purpureofilum_apyrenoidigerum.ctg5742:89-823(-)